MSGAGAGVSGAGVTGAGVSGAGVSGAGVEHNSAEYLHLLIEALQLSFADTQWYCADPAHSAVPTQQLLSRNYATQRRQLIRRDR